MPNDTCCGCGKLHDKKLLMNRSKKKKNPDKVTQVTTGIISLHWKKN